MNYEIGKTYYSFGFHDRELKLPKIESWIYLGSEINIYGDQEGRREYVCFQDAESYAEYGLYTGHGDHYPEDMKVVVISQREDDDESMIDIMSLVDELGALIKKGQI